MPHSPTIAVVADLPELGVVARAQSLARELGLPQVAPPGDEYDLRLVVTQERVELRGRECGQGSSGATRSPSPRFHRGSGSRLNANEHSSAMLSVWVDFVEGRVGQRARSPASGASMLLRAVGFKRAPCRIVDATAGLGRDAFLLASAGCDVTAVERSAVLAALVRDGLRRASDAGEAAAGRLTLVCADARAFLGALPEADRPDAVYLDPMFPPRRKSALVKKDMRLVRLLAGEESGESAEASVVELLMLARSVARSRVTVKRPRVAPPIAGEPAYSYTGTTVRYDVYRGTGGAG